MMHEDQKLAVFFVSIEAKFSVWFLLGIAGRKPKSTKCDKKNYLKINHNIHE